MVGFLWQKGSPVSGTELTRLLQQAQAGDDIARDHLIRSYADWAVRVAAKHCGRYLHRDHDDEASIALSAVDEAVLTYRSDAGSQFTSFLAMVIKRRLIDYHRRQSRHVEPPLRDAGDLEQTPDEEDEKRRQLVEEIEAFMEELGRYGVTLEQLVRSSPKQKDARQRTWAVAEKVVNTPELIASFQQQRELPLKHLAPLVNVSRKTLERQRTYIVAMVIILNGDYRFLRSHVSGTSGGVDDEQAGVSSTRRST